MAVSIGDALRDPFEIKGVQMNVAASVGIALYPSDGDDAQRLLQHADIAMYNAKAASEPWGFYAGDLDEHSRDALELASELSDAIADGQLELRFQPIAQAGGGTVIGVEALVRWAHPTRGLLTPDVFIPLAEQSGRMRDLTRWVIDAALERARAWRDDGHVLRMSVNVSVQDLLDVAFPGEVAAALARHGVDPSMLVLEVTETSIMSDHVRISDTLGQLGEIGVGLSLDDFGTGYSSLVHLKTLPVSEVKIDRGFVAGMARRRHGPRDRACHGHARPQPRPERGGRGGRGRGDLAGAARSRLHPDPGLPPRAGPPGRRGRRHS